MQNYDDVQTAILEGDGTVVKYNLNGQLHRTENTGVILHHSNNTVEVTEYYIINERYREGYSTIVLYCCDGSVVWEECYLNGTRISSGSPLPL